MPLLSLPLPRLPEGIVDHLPIRVPFPFMRIASILPQAINEPIKSSLMALFKLAWSAKLQIPVLITVVFMACDIRLQLEINIFWETNNRQHALHGSNRNTGGVRRSSREDMRRAALVAAALYQQQRRRLIQEMRAQQIRQREAARRQSLPVNAPLATEEDSDLEGSHDGNFSESDTLTCSHRSTTSEAGSFGSDEDETEDGEPRENDLASKRRRRVKRSRPSSREPDDEDDEEEDITTDEESEDDEDDDDDDEDGGDGTNGGSSSQGGGGGGYRDGTYEDDDDSDDLDDNSHGGGGGYNSPLVLEIELRHRPLHPVNNDSCQNMSTAQTKQNTSIICLFNTELQSNFGRNKGKKYASLPTMPQIQLLL